MRSHASLRFGAANSVIALCLLAASVAADAQSSSETYTYDALGRLIVVEVVGGQNDGESHSLCYDEADNRTEYKATSDGSAATCVSDGSGGSPPPPPPPPPSFSVSNAAPVIEGSALTFTVAKSGPATSSYSVNYATANGTATAGSDYTAKSGTLSFSSSETVKQVSVSTANDTVAEPTETILVNLSGATGGATITVSQGTAQISDNDGMITLTDAYLNVLSAHQSTYSCTVYDIPELYYYQEVCNLNSNGVVVYNSNFAPPEDPGYYRPPPGSGTPLQVAAGYYGTGVSP